MTEGSRRHQEAAADALPGLRSEETAPPTSASCSTSGQSSSRLPPRTPLRYGWYLPNFTQKCCFGCGKCEKACRSGALKLEDMPDGQTRVVVTPWKCSECGLRRCLLQQRHRRHEAPPAHHLGPVSVYKCSKTLCADCGKPIAPNSSEGICSVCRIKRRTKQRQERGRSPRQGADRRARGPQGSGSIRKGRCRRVGC